MQRAADMASIVRIDMQMALDSVASAAKAEISISDARKSTADAMTMK